MSDPTKPAVYFLGDRSGGPIERLDATSLWDALAEAKDNARERARDEARTSQTTARQEWVLYTGTPSTEQYGEPTDLENMAGDIEQADPAEPPCAAGKKHYWVNDDPEWAAYSNDQGGGETRVRRCKNCDRIRTLKTMVSDAFGNAYDSVSYTDTDDDGYTGAC